MTVLLVIAILVFLIVVHELGHFIAAKLFRVRVEEFGIGYPPRAFTLGKIGHTEYTLNWIPFGGFVRLYGDVGEEQHGRGSLIDANRAAQAIILIAGVAMNAVAAWVLFVGAYHLGIPRVIEEPISGQEARLVIAHVVPNSPADAAGITAGDEMLELRDARGARLPELTPDAFSAFVQARGGETLTLSYMHANATTSVDITPAHAVVPEGEGRPAIGVALFMVSSHPLSWGESVREASFALVGAFQKVGAGLWNIVERLLAGEPSLSDVIGPIGLAGVVGDAAQSGFGNVLALAAFISVNLAIINLVPIPALDGGRLFVLGIEILMRRPSPRFVLQLLNALGVGLIVLLMVTVTYNDIARLIG